MFAPPEDLDERVFEVVSQLDHAAELVVAPPERALVRRLNLLAGKKARAANAL